MNVAVMAVPLYIALILLELAYERYSGRHTYRLADATTSINTAVLRVLLEGPLRLLLIVPYALGGLIGQAVFDPARERIYRGVSYGVIAGAALIGLPLFD